MRQTLKGIDTAAAAGLPREERYRLALGLHDSTVQSLAALATNLDLVRLRAAGLDPRARRILDESRQLARRCFDEVRALVDALDPRLIDGIEALPRSAPTSRSPQAGH
jgi:signal transduction histidine kinase